MKRTFELNPVASLGAGMAFLSIAACANHSPLPKVIPLPTLTNSIGQTMVQLPEGEFRMGTPNTANPYTRCG